MLTDVSPGVHPVPPGPGSGVDTERMVQSPTSSPDRSTVSKPRAWGIVLTMMCVLALFACSVIPAPRLGLVTVVLALLAVGFRLEAAVLPLRRP